MQLQSKRWVATPRRVPHSVGMADVPPCTLHATHDTPPAPRAPRPAPRATRHAPRATRHAPRATPHRTHTRTTSHITHHTATRHPPPATHHPHQGSVGLEAGWAARRPRPRPRPRPPPPERGCRRQCHHGGRGHAWRHPAVRHRVPVVVWWVTRHARWSARKCRAHRHEARAVPQPVRHAGRCSPRPRAVVPLQCQWCRWLRCGHRQWHHHHHHHRHPWLWRGDKSTWPTRRGTTHTPPSAGAGAPTLQSMVTPGACGLRLLV